jgi:hypothetical protein
MVDCPACFPAFRVLDRVGVGSARVGRGPAQASPGTSLVKKYAARAIPARS